MFILLCVSLALRKTAISRRPVSRARSRPRALGTRARCRSPRGAAGWRGPPPRRRRKAGAPTWARRSSVISMRERPGRPPAPRSAGASPPERDHHRLVLQAVARAHLVDRGAVASLPARRDRRRGGLHRGGIVPGGGGRCVSTGERWAAPGRTASTLRAPKLGGGPVIPSGSGRRPRSVARRRAGIPSAPDASGPGCRAHGTGRPPACTAAAT